MSIRSIIAAVRRWLLKETTAERLARDKDYVERKFTLAQERAANALSKGVTEVKKIAHNELESIKALLNHAAKRVESLTATETLAEDKQAEAKDLKDKIVPPQHEVPSDGE